MSDLATPSRPHRVAVVGAGPAGFYTIQALFARAGLDVRVNLIERLPAPYGLVRYGVAPDHAHTKRVTEIYDRLASDPRCRYFGNVELGTDVALAELLSIHDQVVLCTGAATDRPLDLPGADLRGSHAATDFVAWYNGHPDHAEGAEDRFDLDVERAAVIGAGNVAIDVARILMRDPGELVATDIAGPALAALQRSRIRELHVLARRDAAHAAFTSVEVRGLGSLAGVQTLVDPAELVLPATADRVTRTKIEILRRFAEPPDPRIARHLWLRFRVSPTALDGDATGRVTALTLVHNEVVAGADGSTEIRPTSRTERLEVGLVLRAIGYRGVRVTGAPFDESSGTIPSAQGRVLDRHGGHPIPGLYVTGWIKRGPHGVIGTNRSDAAETVGSMLEDRAAAPPRVTPHPELSALLDRRGVRVVSWGDWVRLDALEIERGRRVGRPRVKFLSREEFLEGEKP